MIGTQLREPLVQCMGQYVVVVGGGQEGAEEEGLDLQRAAHSSEGKVAEEELALGQVSVMSGLIQSGVSVSDHGASSKPGPGHGDDGRVVGVGRDAEVPERTPTLEPKPGTRHEVHYLHARTAVVGRFPPNPRCRRQLQSTPLGAPVIRPFRTGGRERQWAVRRPHGGRGQRVQIVIDRQVDEAVTGSAQLASIPPVHLR